MRAEDITDFGALQTLEREWSALWEACPTATPFQSPEWNIAWWEAFRPGRLAAVAVRDGADRLAGFAPLYIGEDGVLRFLGSGNTDYLDVLAPSGTAAVILEHLAHTHGAWDRCDLLELPESGVLASTPLPSAFAAETGVSSTCPIVPLPASPSAGLRRNIRRYGERLSAAGDTRFEVECGAHHSEYLEALFRLHTASWRQRHAPGVLAREQVRSFHRRVAAGFAARGWLRMFGLRHEGTLAAVIYAFAARGRVYFYLSGFTPELAAFSPSTLLTAYALEECSRSGIGEADLLRGEESYKYRWGARNRLNRRLTLVPSESVRARGGGRVPLA